MEQQFQRWTAKRKAELILELIKGSRNLVDVCREFDLKQSEVESWTETFLKCGEKGLKANAEDEQAAKESEIKELRAKVGELYLELEFRKKYQALNDQNATSSSQFRAK